MANNVIVGCKLPNGLHLDHQGTRHTLNGSNHAQIVGGYGMTEVPKDFFEAWSEANKDSPLLTSEVIFSQGTRPSAESAAKERGEVQSGFEPLNGARPYSNVTADAEVMKDQPTNVGKAN